MMKHSSVSHTKSIRRRYTWRLLLIAFLVASILVPLNSGIQPLFAQTESGDGNAIWNEPVNISQSGSASRPVIATEPDGRIHVLWWDKFDGTKYAFTRKDGTWTDPVTVSSIIGLRQRTQTGTSIAPPEELTLLADNDGTVHAFWRNSLGDLLYARASSGNTNWSSAARLVTAPLVWNVFLGSDNTLNLAFIRSTTVAGAVPGVYFRRALAGTNWSEPTLINESLYFRTQPSSDASISVITDSKKMVIVAWNDPQTGQSKTAQSTNSGGRFTEPEVIDGGGIVEAAVPRFTRFVDLPDGKFSRLWEAGASCVLYEQILGDDDSWSPPVRVLERLNGCLRTKRTFHTDDNRVFMMVGSFGSLNAMVAWDGLGWSTPVAPQANFISSAGDLISLGCINLAILQDSVALAGCDQNGDVWVLTSKVSLEEFLPAVSNAWSWPTILSGSDTNSELPNVTADSTGRWHLIWEQALAAGISGDALNYRRGDGETWSDTAAIQQIAAGQISDPSLVTDPNGMVHAVWSGGETGTILYSRAFARDALVSSDWTEAVSIPALQPVGASPNIALGKSGKLYVVYAIPFNEDRGIYYSTSSDLGVSWSAPVKVFDATAAGWVAIPEVQLALDSQENIYVAWSRATIPNEKSPAGVFFSKSTDGGLTWIAPMEISGRADDHPRLIVTNENIVYMTWTRTIATGYELWQAWSPDSGVNWSPIVRVPGFGPVAPDMSLITDNAGSIHLVGIEQTREGTASIFYTRWNGSEWIDRDNVRLAYNFVDGLGVRAALSPNGSLGVFYRIQVPNADGRVHYVVAFTGRQLIADENIAPAPTFTPRPSSTPLPAATAEPTLTALPAVDLNATPNSWGGTSLLQLALVGVGMVIVSIVAVARLLNRIRR